jgi:hypothetical protein
MELLDAFDKFNYPNDIGREFMISTLPTSGDG